MPDPLNVVVDISHHNGNVNLAKAKEDGISAIGRRRRTLACSGALTISRLEAMASSKPNISLMLSATIRELS
jgi:hypothetical protein